MIYNMNKRRFTLFVIIWLAVTIPAVIILIKPQSKPTPATTVTTEDPRQYDASAYIERQLAEKKARYEANISRYPTTPQKLLELVNSERAKAHVAPLRLDSRLNYSASLKLADMHKYDYNDHVNHDGTQGYELIFKQINALMVVKTSPALLNTALLRILSIVICPAPLATVRLS